MRSSPPRYIDIDVDPCTKYVIEVLASEDYQVVIQQEKKDARNPSFRGDGRISRPTL